MTIEEIASKVAMGPFGSDIKTDNFVPAGVPIIRGGNLTSGRFHGEGFVFLTKEKADELANANAFPGDIVFTSGTTLEGRIRHQIRQLNTAAVNFVQETSHA